MFTGIQRYVKLSIYLGVLAVLSLISFFVGSSKTTLSSGLLNTDTAAADHTGSAGSVGSAGSDTGVGGGEGSSGEGGGGCSGGCSGGGEGSA